MAMMGSRRRSSKSLRVPGGQNLFCCGRRRFRVAYPEQPLQDLADHHEAAAKIRLERADFQVVGLIMRDGANEFVRDPRLSEAGIACNEHHLAFAIARVVPGLVQHLQLHLATDEG